MPKVKEGYLEAQREKILDAATVCFARNGFTLTTVLDICQEARLSIGALYRYFQTKEDIIEASVQRHREDRAKRFEALKKKKNVQEALEGLFQLQVIHLLSTESSNNAKVMVHSYSEALHNPQVKNIVQRNWQEMSGHLETIVQKAQKTGEINPAFEAHAIALLMNAITDGLFLQRVLVPDSRKTLEQALEIVKALFVFGKVQSTGAGSGEDKSHENKLQRANKRIKRSVTKGY